MEVASSLATSTLSYTFSGRRLYGTGGGQRKSEDIQFVVKDGAIHCHTAM